MGYKLSKNSLDRLAKVTPNLQAIVKRAIELSAVDFVVTQGLRTLDDQQKLYGKGRSAAECTKVGVPVSYASPMERKVTWTLKSNHMGGKAVDVAPWVNGRLEWDEDGKLGLWPQIADAFKQAAAELGVKLTWGGDWVKNKDRPHFEVTE